MKLCCNNNNNVNNHKQNKNTCFKRNVNSCPFCSLTFSEFLPCALTVSTHAFSRFRVCIWSSETLSHTHQNDAVFCILTSNPCSVCSYMTMFQLQSNPRLRNPNLSMFYPVVSTLGLAKLCKCNV